MLFDRTDNMLELIEEGVNIEFKGDVRNVIRSFPCVSVRYPCNTAYGYSILVGFLDIVHTWNIVCMLLLRSYLESLHVNHSTCADKCAHTCLAHFANFHLHGFGCRYCQILYRRADWSWKDRAYLGGRSRRSSYERAPAAG